MKDDRLLLYVTFVAFVLGSVLGAVIGMLLAGGPE